MLNTPQIQRLLGKLVRLEETLEKMIFVNVAALDDMKMFQTGKQYHSVPDEKFVAVEKNTVWSGEGTYCWFKGTFTVPQSLAGKRLFVRPHIGGYEAMLFVNGKPFGTFATKIVYTQHGNHYCDMITESPEAGEKIDIAIEYYAGHMYPGCMPLEAPPVKDFSFEFDGADICIKDEAISDFYFDLVTLNQMAEVLPENSFRRAEVVNALVDVYNTVYCSYEDTSDEKFRSALKKAAVIMKAVLAKKNGDSAPHASVIGHSHMDTAWLWHVDETIKKCARTYSNQLSLMQQYPEYKFVQSSACHGNMLLKHYPELFERIKEAVAQGRYEPNGGVWVECDCNITSGESMVRQFLWGQRFTQKHFNYTSNCFWLPDTFGYSAAIPQIMKGCNVDYFLTTKISWNDTNRFPYDTFRWQGLDGTEVFVHFNTTHHFPDAKDIYERINGDIKQKSVTDKRLLAFGFGDGGGGPQFEMIELARRCKNTDGIPETDYELVGDFMKRLEKDAVNPNVYKGELYLELHRGTLTNQHTIKRNNRKAELALHDLEFTTVTKAVEKKKAADSTDIAPLYETLLLNQFHDILPGTAINRAHEESRAQTHALIEKAHELTNNILCGESADNTLTVTNTLSFNRADALFLDYKEGMIIDGGYPQQLYTDLDGNKKLIVSGVAIPAFSSVTLKYVKGDIQTTSAFAADDNKLKTAFAEVEFAENGTIASFVDISNSRQLVKGEPFNTFMLAEDMPSAWDNWDIDADIENKFVPASNLIGSCVVSDGAAAYIIRSEYKISEKSTVTQDMMFFCDSAEVRFDTAIDWNDDHRFLKTAFDTGVYEDFARHEIQFGYVKRPTTRNTTEEQAKFEVVNHKYTDLSETKYGVSILNDCKYGISVNGGKMRLSLHKGGNHPDYKGDKDGIHRCVYSLLPHNSPFGAESVIKPSYMLNVPAIITRGKTGVTQLMTISASNIIAEAVKPCEDSERAFIVRLYEAEGTYTDTHIDFFEGAEKVFVTDMLENEKEELTESNRNCFVFRPFEIKTLKITY